MCASSKQKNSFQLKVPLTALTVTCADEHLLHKIQIHTQLIRGVTHAQELHFKAGATCNQNQPFAMGDTWIATACLGSRSKTRQRKIKIDIAQLKRDAQTILGCT